MAQSDIRKILREAQRLLVQGNAQEALKQFRIVKAQQPDNLEALYGIALIQLRQGQLPKALVKLRTVARAMPEHGSIRANYALALAAAKKKGPARQQLLAAVQLNQKAPKTLLQLAKALSTLGFGRESTKVLPPEEDSSLTPDQQIACIEIALAASDRGMARRRLAALPAHPDLANEHWITIALFAEQLNALELGVKAFEKYASSCSLRAEELVFGLALYLQQRALDKAEALAEQGLENGMNGSAPFLTLVARLMLLKGERDKAIAYLDEAVSADPANGQAWLFLAQHYDAGQMPALEEKLKAVLPHASAVASSSLQYALGDIRRRQDNVEGAFQAFAAANAAQQAHNEGNGTLYDAEKNDKVRENIFGLFTTLKPSEKAVSEAAPVFIVGMPRSGTSLLERMISALTGAPMNGENFALGHVCERYYSDYVGDKAPAPDALDTARLGKFAKRYWDMSHHHAHLATDKMPVNYRHIGMALAFFPNAPILHLRRNPMDTLWSIYRREFPASYAYASDFDALAHAYWDSEKYMAFWKEKAPERILTVDYETLVASPEAETRRIASFVGVPWVEDCLHTHDMDEATFTFSDTQVRAPVHDDYVGRWKPYEEFLGPLKEALERYSSAT